MKKSIISLVLALTLLLGISTGCAPKDDKEAKAKIIVGTSASYVPWAFKKDEVLQGYEIDVWNEIGKRSGYEIEFVLAKFAGLFGMLDAGQIDTIAHQISTTPERKEKYDFSDTYAYSSLSFTIPEDQNPTSIEDMKGKTIGVGLGGNSEKSIRRMNEEYNLGLNIITYDSAVNVASEVVNGRIDAQFVGTTASLSTIKDGNLPLKIFDPGYVVEINQYPFARTEASAAKIKAVNEALDAMKKDGTLEKLSQKWFSIDVTVDPTAKG